MKEIEYNNKSLDKALCILELFMQKKAPFSLKDISEYTGNNNTTVLRILRTLQNRNFVSFNKETKKYSLGYKIYLLATKVDSIQELVDICHPTMEELALKTRLVSHLAIIENNSIIIIDKVAPKNKEVISMKSQIGKIVPIHCTSVGKILISQFEDEKINKIVGEELQKYTEYTITDKEAFIEHIHQVRKKGYATTANEHEDFINCISYPIRNIYGEIVCAISVSGFEKEFEGIKNEFYHTELLNTVKDISSKLQ